MNVDDAFDIMEKVLTSPYAKEQIKKHPQIDYTPKALTSVGVLRQRKRNNDGDIEWIVYMNFGYVENSRTRKQYPVTIRVPFSLSNEDKKDRLLDALYTIQDINFKTIEDINIGEW